MNDIPNNDRRFLYFYFNRHDPEKVRPVVPAHIEYWRAANPKGYMGGPFADRTGGLISFVAANVEEAAALIQSDPFVLENLLEQKWIKEWQMESILSKSPS